MKDYQNIGTGDNNILCFMDVVFIPRLLSLMLWCHLSTLSFIDIDECDYTRLLLWYNEMLDVSLTILAMMNDVLMDTGLMD